MKDNKIHIYRTRTKFLLGVFVSILTLVIVRFFYLQIVQGNELRELREQNINAFLDSIDLQFGSMKNFIQGELEVSAEELSELQNNFLEGWVLIAYTPTLWTG